MGRQLGQARLQIRCIFNSVRDIEADGLLAAREPLLRLLCPLRGDVASYVSTTSSWSNIVWLQIPTRENHDGTFPCLCYVRYRRIAELLRQRGYEVEVYPEPEAPPKSLIIEKVKSGIDGLITTLRDSIDAEIFEAGKGKLKVVARSPSALTTSTAPMPTGTRFRSLTRRMSSPKPPRNSRSSCWAPWREKCGPRNI